MRNDLLVLAAMVGLASSACAGALAQVAPRTAPGSESKPNLVFIMADQLRYQSCGFAGDTRARTPQLDALAKQGVVFRNAVSGHPVCAAFRASLFTGKYTTSTGMVINELRLSTNHVFLGQVLTREGYDTGYIGKWHLWANELGNHYDPKNSFVPPGPYRFGFDGFWAAYNFHHEYYKAYSAYPFCCHLLLTVINGMTSCRYGKRTDPHRTRRLEGGASTNAQCNRKGMDVGDV